jgi:hypothetical protein
MFSVADVSSVSGDWLLLLLANSLENEYLGMVSKLLVPMSRIYFQERSDHNVFDESEMNLGENENVLSMELHLRGNGRANQKGLCY